MMRCLWIGAVLLASLFGMAGQREALAIEKVKIGAMHMCCPICEKTIYGVLKKAKGITVAKVNRAGNECTFTAADRASAEAAIGALIEEGYWGFFKINSEDYHPKVDEADATAKYNVVVFDSVHLCCNACGVSIGNTVEIGQPKGLNAEENDFNRANKTATFHGEGMDAAELLKLMHNAGFHGKFNKEKSEKAE